MFKINSVNKIKSTNGEFFSVNAMKNNHYIVCIIPLDKTQDSYANILKLSKIEIALDNSTINKVWPFNEISGFRFHLGQSWYRTIQKLIPSTKYEQITEITEIYVCIFDVCRVIRNLCYSNFLL